VRASLSTIQASGKHCDGLICCFYECNLFLPTSASIDEFSPTSASYSWKSAAILALGSEHPTVVVLVQSKIRASCRKGGETLEKGGACGKSRRHSDL
jgi:hypothetical protein